MTTVKIHDAQTNQIIERKMTDEELANYEARIAAKEEEKRVAEAAANAKTALLAKLGITEEEAKLLLS